MIAELTGELKRKDGQRIVIDVQGVGYRVHVVKEYGQKLAVGAKITLLTYLAVRENALDLYGFENLETLDYFELLITVPGIGPKSALAILSLAAPAVLRQAITAEDTAYLTRVSGIGQKNAEKIVLTLKDKLVPAATPSGETSVDLATEADALEALKSFGYAAAEAREALKKAGGGDTSARIKAALQALGNR